ncbi:MAG: flagellar hook-basal body complex protein FliE [candidate division Zixibacteria bacterium]|nr:flagellar hook-basal body complex protein FliE [candidate division Zixibacteria bacterium]
MSNPVGNINRMIPGLIEKVTGGQGEVAGPDAKSGVSFGDVLSNMINSVNETQLDAAQSQQALMAGEPVELHDVMIKAQEAGISMDLLLEVRNKLMSAYNEIMRMQM